MSHGDHEEQTMKLENLAKAYELRPQAHEDLDLMGWHQCFKWENPIRKIPVVPGEIQKKKHQE